MAGVLQYALSLDTGKFTGPMGTAGGAVRGFTGGLSGLASKLTSLPALFAGAAAGAGILGTAVKAIKTAADFESTAASFTTLMGSTEKANKLLKQIESTAASTPNTFDELSSSARKLLAVSDEKNIIKDLRMIGDLASASQKPISDLASMYAKIKGGDVVQGEDLNMIGDALGGKALEEFAKVLGVDSVKAVRKLGSEGKISGAVLEQVFVNLTSKGGMAFGAMAAQSKTTNGLLSTLKDNITGAMRALGTPFNDLLKPYLNTLIKSAAALGPLAAEWGGQIASIIKTLGDGFSTIFSLFRTESDFSFSGMLTDVLRVTQELATRFVGAVQLLKSAIDQGKIGEMLSLSLQLGAMSAANALLSGFISTIDLIGRYFHFQLKQLVSLFTGGFNEGIGSIFSALPSLIGGMGMLIYAKLSGPFQEVAAIFSAGLAKGLDLLKQGISQIPGLNEVFGLKDFKATSFEQLLGEMRSSGDTETAARMGDEMLGEGMDKLRKGLGQMGEVVTGNFKDAFAGFKPSQLKLFETDETQAALKDLAKSIDPAAFEKLTAPAAAIAKASKDSLTAAREVARTPSPATPPKPPPVSKKSVEAQANLRSEMELIAAKAAGDRKRVAALNREAAIKKGLESGLSLADATKKARLDQAVSNATNPESHQERRDRERGERKEARNILREYKKLPKGNEDGALNRLLTPAAAAEQPNTPAKPAAPLTPAAAAEQLKQATKPGPPLTPAAAAEQLGRGGRAADPGRVRREEKAEANRVKTDPLFRIVKSIEEKFDNLVTA